MLVGKVVLGKFPRWEEGRDPDHEMGSTKTLSLPRVGPRALGWKLRDLSSCCPVDPFLSFFPLKGDNEEL